MDDWSAYGAIIIALGTLVWTATRGRSEVAHQAALTAGELAGQVRSLAKDLEAEHKARRALAAKVEAVERRLSEYEYGVNRLAAQLTMLGHEPVWTPPAKQP